jgi:hypothetical protein
VLHHVSYKNLHALILHIKIKAILFLLVFTDQVLENQENNNQGVGIGDACSNDADCSLTNGVCVYDICFCSPLYRYSQTINDCVQGKYFINRQGAFTLDPLYFK